MQTDNLQLICRACLQEGVLNSMFNHHKKLSITYSEMLYYCVSVKVETDDRSPGQICKKCVTNLVAFYKFKKCVNENEKKLQQILSNLKGSTRQEPAFFAREPQIDYPQAIELKNDPEFVKISSIDESSETEDVVVDEPLTEIKFETAERVENKTESNELEKDQGEITSKASQCEICGKILSCHSNLVLHKRCHSGEKPFACDLCEKRFARTEHLNIHRRIHTGERPHPCTVCPKRFVQLAALTAHLRTHSGERPHMCAICGKCFSQSVSLTYHMRTHTGEMPFRCQICNKGFAHNGNLNIHMRFHRNERPFVCSICGRRFVTSSHLTVHIKQHKGDKSHRCNICGKGFVRSEHLKDHLVIHTGQKPHACTLCPKRYTQSSHLKRHMKTHKT